MGRPKLSEFEKRLRSEIAANLKSISHGMTQREMSEKTGIPASTLSGYFNETSTIIPVNLEKLAEFFHVDPGQIDPRYNSPHEAIGRRIRATREAKRLSVADLANKVKKTENILRRYEDGSMEVPLTVLLSLAEALDTPLPYLLTGESSFTLSDEMKNLINAERKSEDDLSIFVISDILESHGFSIEDHQGDELIIRDEDKSLSISKAEVKKLYDASLNHFVKILESLMK